MSEWNKGRLDNFFTLKRGYDLPKQKRALGSIPIVSSSGVTDYHNVSQVEESGVITGRYGTIGEVFFSKDPFWPLNTTLYVNDFKNNDKKFIYYFLKTLDWEQYNDKSAVPGVNRNHVHAQEVSFPHLNEQKAIASVLSSLDDKIGLLHRQNKTLESMAETLFRQWFIEEAQDEWEEVKLSEYVELNKSSINKNYVFKEIQYLDTSSLTKGIISELQFMNLSESPSRAKRLVQNFDILISTVRPEQCHYGICIEPPQNLVVSTGFCVISSKSISPFFIYYLLTSGDMTEYLHSIAEGSTSTYPSLKPEDIGNVSFLYPGKEKLNRFHEFVGSYWNKIHLNHNKIRTLERLRDTLLPKLMSGEVRVRYEAEPAVSAV